MALTGEAIAAKARPLVRAKVRAVFAEDERVNTGDDSVFMEFIDSIVDGISDGIAEALTDPEIAQVIVGGSTGVIA